MTEQGQLGIDVQLLVRRLVDAGRSVGATAPYFASLAENRRLYREVISLIRRKTAGPTYDAAAVSSFFGLQYPKQGLRQFITPPIPLPGFLTFFDPGWTLLRLRRFGRKKGIPFPQKWYEHEPFAKVHARPCYRHLRVAPVSGSLGKTFTFQQDGLLAGEVIPRVRVVITAMLVHFLATGERLYRPEKVRCIDTTAAGGNAERVRNLLAAVGRLSPPVLGLATSVYDPMVHYQQVRDAWTGIRNPDGR